MDMDEACQTLGVSRFSLRRYRIDGKLTGRRHGNRVLFLRKDVQKLLRGQRKG